MRNFYPIDPLLSATLAYEQTNREDTILAGQMGYLAKSFKERIKDLDKAELAYITYIILDTYSKQEGKNDFFESLLDVIQQQLNE